MQIHLVVGNLMKPVTDKLKISRAKLAFIVDATAAPIASIFIISSWIGYEVRFNSGRFADDRFNRKCLQCFYRNNSLQVLSHCCIFFVFFLSYTQRDFGPMFKAEIKA